VIRSPLLLIVSLALAACAGGGGATPTGAASGPSGSLGVFTQADADTTVAGLCHMTTIPLASLDDANGTFYDSIHENLHVLAAATEGVDRHASGELLQAKAVVEQDLLADTALPATFHGDVEALLIATRSAVTATGLRAAACR
jgi:hypothetical protein